MNGPSGRITISALVAALAVVALAFVPASLPAGDNFGTSGSAARPIGDLYEGRLAVQEFISSGTEIQALTIQIATYGRHNAGKLYITVQAEVDGQWRTLAKKKFSKRKLIDNEFKEVRFRPALRVKRGQRIALSVRSDKDPSQAITWWMNPEHRAEGMRLTVDGVEQTGSAVFSVAYKRIAGTVGEIRKPLWKRMTVFLRPTGRACVAIAALVALLCFVHLVLWGAAPISSRELP